MSLSGTPCLTPLRLISRCQIASIRFNAQSPGFLHKGIARKSTLVLRLLLLFRISSAVEQWTVNPLVASSNLASGVSRRQALKTKILSAFLFSGLDFPHFFPTFPQHITTNTKPAIAFRKWALKVTFS